MKEPTKKRWWSYRFFPMRTGRGLPPVHWRKLAERGVVTWVARIDDSEFRAMSDAPFPNRPILAYRYDIEGTDCEAIFEDERAALLWKLSHE